MKIKICQNRDIKNYGTAGTEQENKVVIMEFEFPEEIQDYVKYIEFEIDDNNKVFDLIQNDKYTLTSAITKYQDGVKAQVVAKKDTDVWKSKMFELKFNKSINADHEIEDEEQIDILNTVIERVQAIEDDIEELNEKIDNLFIPSKTSDLTNDSDFVSDSNYVHTDNNFDNTYKTKLDGLENYDDTEIKQDIADLEANKADKSEIPDVSNFITNAVDNLLNYYLKSETYTKQEVNNLIGQIATLQFQVVNELPQTGDSKYIYLVPSTNPKTKNIKDEYIWTNNAWEQIGSTQVDLTGYATETWVNTQISGFLTQAQIEALITTALTGYVKTEDIPTELSDLNDDSTHRTVTDTDKTKLNKISGYYGTCVTGASTAAKVVVCEDFVLEEGAVIYVKFTNAQTYNGTATLNVNGTGAKDIARVGTTKTTRYYWSAGELIGFVYDGTNYLMMERGTATTSYYGLTKLATSATSTADTAALTPKSLNSFAQGVVANYPVYSTSATYEVGDRVRYSYGIYECIVAIPVKEAWTAEHWTLEKTLQEQIDDVSSSIPDELADLAEDSTHRTVTDIEKATWNNKSDFSGDYNDLSNKPTIPTVPTNVSAFTNDAGYLTSHQDISGKEDKTNKVTSISSSSTDTQYPSAKCVYDIANPYEIPSYWESSVNNVIESVKEKQSISGNNCINFIMFSDMHIINGGTNNAHNVGKLSKKLMEECNIPLAIFLGDYVNGNGEDTKDKLLQDVAAVKEILKPIESGRLCTIKGNHDLFFASSNSKTITPQKLFNEIYRPNLEDMRRVSSGDGTYYYIDNIPQKTRFICLNSNWGQWTVDANNTPSYSVFSHGGYGQEQLEFLASSLDVEEDWSVCVFTHVPPLLNTYTNYFRDADIFIGILTAYANKTTYSGTYAGSYTWDAVNVSVDYTNSNGELVALFTGHRHIDEIYTNILPVPIITITTSSGQKLTDHLTRTYETNTETALDVVTIDKQNQMIYTTRLGVGVDRSVSYAPPRPAYINLADPTSEDWAENKRMDSSLNLVDLSGNTVSNWIPIQKGDVIRVKGFSNLRSDNVGANVIGIANSSKGKMASIAYTGTTGVIESMSYDSTTATGTIIMSSTTQYVPAYFRIGAALATGYTAEDVIITVNEEIP